MQNFTFHYFLNLLIRNSLRQGNLSPVLPAINVVNAPIRMAAPMWDNALLVRST